MATPGGSGTISPSGQLSLKDLHEDFRRYPESNPTNISLGDLIDDFLCEGSTNKSMSSFHGSTYLGPFVIKVQSGEDSEEACEFFPPTTYNGKGAGVRYHNGTTKNPTANDFVYLSYKGLNGASCSNTFQPVGSYKMDTGKVMVMSSTTTGQVKSIVTC